MSLHVDSHGGGGDPLLFIHGWGMHGGMWGGVLSQLAQHFQVMAVDLPGHGSSSRSQDLDRAGLPRTTNGLHPKLLREGLRIEEEEVGTNSELNLDAIVDKLSAQFTEPLTVCGWSLGGQVALRWAMRYPQQVSRLVLVSSTPCFVQQAGWPCAMAADTLAAFSAALQQDYASTLRRFLALQVRGSEQEREQLLTLRASLASRGEPDLAALQSGLEILRDVDLRDALPQISTPVLVIAGVRDTLTPMPASQYLATQMPHARLAAIEGAAHAPFLSHPDEFVKHVAGFLHELEKSSCPQIKQITQD
ncbi:MAG: alpha/beta fold hydrolase [Gallionella sp.]|jgi:pimeloyl-[acyl-carrier protein] methyl ester esterase